MPALNFLSDPLWQRVAWALLHFVWQGALVGFSLFVVLSLVRGAHARYWLALGAMLVLVACPLVTMGLVEVDGMSGMVDPHPSPLPEGEGAGMAVDVASVVVADDNNWREAALNVLVALRPYVLLAWLAGVCALGARLLTSYLMVRRVRASAVELRHPLLLSTYWLARKLRLQGRVRIAVSHAIEEALVLGLWRPLILVPASWLTEMPAATLEAIIAHELAHIRRHDLWVNLAQRVVETLLFYHPAVWYVSRVLRVEREQCCDLLAVAATGERLVYVEALELVASKRLAASPALLAAAMGGTKPMNLLTRVQNVLGLAPSTSSARYWPVGVAALVLPAGMWCASLAFSPVATAQEEAKESADAKAATVIDEFVRDRLEKIEVPGADGDKAVFLRRLMLDLTGVPPTPEEAERFQKAGDEDARSFIRVLVAQSQDRPREGDRPRDGDQPREGDAPRAEANYRRVREANQDQPAREGADRGDVRQLIDEQMRLIREMRNEMQQLRREINELRERRGQDAPAEGVRRIEADRQAIRAREEGIRAEALRALQSQRDEAAAQRYSVEAARRALEERTQLNRNDAERKLEGAREELERVRSRVQEAAKRAAADAANAAKRGEAEKLEALKRAKEETIRAVERKKAEDAARRAKEDKAREDGEKKGEDKAEVKYHIRHYELPADIKGTKAAIDAALANAKDFQVRTEIDPSTKQLIVYATLEQQKMIEGILAKSGEPRFSTHLYTLAGDGEATKKLIDTYLAKDPEARSKYDPNAKRLMVRASPAVQKTVAAVLAKTKAATLLKEKTKTPAKEGADEKKEGEKSVKSEKSEKSATKEVKGEEKRESKEEAIKRIGIKIEARAKEAKEDAKVEKEDEKNADRDENDKEPKKEAVKKDSGDKEPKKVTVKKDGDSEKESAKKAGGDKESKKEAAEKDDDKSEKKAEKKDKEEKDEDDDD